MMGFERLTLPPGLSLVATLSRPVLDFLASYALFPKGSLMHFTRTCRDSTFRLFVAGSFLRYLR